MTEVRETVLLVDDDPTIRMLVRSGLTKRGFQVADVGEGALAIERFRNEHHHIVLVDAMMPGMDGFAVCKAIRELPEGEHVPIVMLTGLEDDASIARAYDSGATDFYVKSHQMTLLAERLRYLLRTARLREELSRSRARLAAAQRIARLGSWDWDLARKEILASPECRRILGLDGSRDEEGEPIGEGEFISRFYPDGLDAFRFQVLASLRAGREHLLRGSVALADGDHALEIEVDAERDKQGAIVRVNGTVQDVTERRAAEARMHRLANFDGLTGLANRTLFRARLEEAIASARGGENHVGILVVGLDRFKAVNETFGQTGGDALLREVAARLNGMIRNRDAVGRVGRDEENSAVARLGADEFTILLRDLAQRDHAARVAERVLEALAKPFLIDGNEVWATASIGIAACPEDADSGETLLSRASAAMRAAKSGGRNTFRFYERAVTDASSSRMRLETDLRRALDRGELRLHWQPIMSAAGDAVKGAEVLMRWQRGDKLVSPAEFIPLAEDTGLIVPMGEWALETATAQLAHWRAKGASPFYVGVNMSASHIQQRDVERHVADLLEKNQLPADALSLEITETLMMDLVQPARRGLHALKKLGVRIAIDDFGTGYSSLSYLKRLPVTTIKIDRSFVNDIATDSDDAAIVSAITGLAKSLSLGIVAEGVETAEQHMALRARGVDAIQGYYFSKPLPVDAFERFIFDKGALPAAA